MSTNRKKGHLCLYFLGTAFWGFIIIQRISGTDKRLLKSTTCKLQVFKNLPYRISQTGNCPFRHFTDLQNNGIHLAEHFVHLAAHTKCYLNEDL